MILGRVTSSPWDQTCHAFHDVESNIEILWWLSMKARSVTVKKPSLTPVGKSESRDTVQSLSRALSLLNALAAQDGGLPLSEVARTVGLAISTAHRLLSTLQQEGFVRFDEERGVWIVGVQAFIVGSAFLRSRELTAVARPVMRRLMERSGETVNLAVTDRGESWKSTQTRLARAGSIATQSVFSSSCIASRILRTSSKRRTDLSGTARSSAPMDTAARC
jgi:hypothetical protein